WGERLVGLPTRGSCFLRGLIPAVGGDAVEHRGELRAARLFGVVAVHPLGIAADRIDDEAAGHPIAPPDISVGCDAIGTAMSMKSGYFWAHSQACMPPIEYPRTSRMRRTPKCSVTSRYWADTISS